MITQTFGNLLYYPESENLKEFPSPEELKHKILISTKPPKECLEEESHLHNASASSNSSDKGKDVIEIEYPSQRKVHIYSICCQLILLCDHLSII